MIGRIFLTLALAAPLAAQFSFEKVEVLTGYAQAREGDKGRLEFSPGKIRFLNEGGGELFEIPAKSVAKLFYSSFEGRRGGTPLSKPFDLLGGTRHFLTVSFQNDALLGAVEFKLHKSNYENILRNAELITGLTVERDMPEPPAPPLQPAVVSEASGPALLEILSTPAGAEVEINNSFNGLTPRRKSVEPGDYRIVIRKAGYEPFERMVSVDPGQTLEVHGELRALQATAR
jgi:hypothetical protein